MNQRAYAPGSLTTEELQTHIDAALTAARESGRDLPPELKEYESGSARLFRSERDGAGSADAVTTILITVVPIVAPKVADALWQLWETVILPKIQRAAGVDAVGERRDPK